MAAKRCCLDLGFSALLRDLLRESGDPTTESLCSPTGDLAYALMLLGLSKASNIEVECNFARASSARSAARGTNCAATMSSKHVLAELSHQHSMHMQPSDAPRSKRAGKRTGLLRGGANAKYSRHVTTSDFRKIANGSRSESSSSAAMTKAKRRQVCPKYNSWILFRNHRLASRPARLGESAAMRQKRVIEEASNEFKDPANFVEKQNFTVMAKQMNAAAAHSMRFDSGNADGDRHPEVSGRICDLIAQNSNQTISACENWDKKYGPWGAADKQWPIAVDTVKHAVSSSRSFVHCKSMEWRAGRSKPVKASQEMEQAVEVSKGRRDEISFCMKLGGCFWQSSDFQQMNITRNLELFRNIVRYLRKGAANRTAGNRSVDADVAPLLVFASSKETAKDPEIFLLVKPNFRAWPGSIFIFWFFAFDFWLTGYRLFSRLTSLKSNKANAEDSGPYDVCFWRCRLVPISDATDSAHVCCPQSFDAELCLGLFIPAHTGPYRIPYAVAVYRIPYTVYRIPYTVRIPYTGTWYAELNELN